MKFTTAFFRSFSIYFLSECIVCQYKDTKKEDALKRISFGTCVDVILMRTFYRYIDKLRIASAAKKVALEQITVAPVIGSSFLFIHDSLTFQNLKNMYFDDCRYWLPVSFIGYHFVSTERRFLYVGFASVLWNNIRIMVYT
jgi:hypothetical protein